MRGAGAVLGVLVALVAGLVAGAVLTGFGASGVASLRDPPLALVATEPPGAPPGVRGLAGAAVVWTGAAHVVVGGGRDGAPVVVEGRAPVWALEATGASWRTLPSPPLAPRTGARAVLAGTEVVVVGGEGVEAAPRDAAALDPATGAWRTVAPPPVAPGTGPPAVATAGHVVVATGDTGLLLLLDVAADRWATVPVDGPVSHLHALGDGSVGVVLAGPGRPTVDVVVLDPGADEVAPLASVTPPATTRRLPGEPPPAPARAALVGDAAGLLLLVERPGEGTSVHDLTAGAGRRVGVVDGLRAGGAVGDTRGGPVLRRGGVVVEVGFEPGGTHVGVAATARTSVEVAGLEGPGPRCRTDIGWAADDAGGALVLGGDCDGALLHLEAADVPLG